MFVGAHRRWLSALCLIAAGILLPAQAGSAREKKQSFEVRGRLIPPEGVSIPRAGIIVQLSDPLSPSLMSAVAGSDGRFRLKGIPTGMYVISAFIPRMARTRRTIEVGPSSAKNQGRIEITLKMEASIRRPGMYLVSAEQLAIPEQARSEFEKGRQHLGKSDLPGASARFKRAVDLAPQFGAAWHQLGTVAYLSGNYQESISNFREALKLLPENFQVLISLGAALAAENFAAEAAAINARAAKVRPTDPQAHVQLGYSLILLERLDEAEVHLKKAVELDPANYYFPQLQLAEIYRRRNDLVSMAGALEEFIGLHPDSEKAREVKLLLEDVRSRISVARSGKQ